MFNCSLCKYKSNKKYNLTRHMVSKHKNEDYKNVIVFNKNVMVDHKNVIVFNKNVMVDHKNVTNDNKCLKCNKILSSKQYLEKHLLICKGITNPLECHLCHKILANRSSKSAHLKICKEVLIKEPLTELTNNNNTIININNNINNINNINNGIINNNNTTNIIIFDPLKPYGTTLKTDHINLDFISKLLKIKEKDALTLYTKKILDNPENRCIKKTNLRSIYSEIYIGDNKWDCCSDNDIYPKFISEISNCLGDLLLSKNLSRNVINKLIEFIDYMAEDGYCNDDDKCDEIMKQYKEQIKKTKLIVYNLRDLIK